MSLRVILLLTMLCALALGSDPDVPTYPSCFEADCTVSQPIFGSQSGHMWVEEDINMTRTDLKIFGTTVTTIQDGNKCVEYQLSKVFGQQMCNVTFLTNPMYSYAIPPFAKYVGPDVIDGKDTDEWELNIGVQPAKISNSWWVDTKADPPELVQYLMSVSIFKFQMNFDNMEYHDSFDKSIFAVPDNCPPPICTAAVEVVLVLDGSGSISADSFSTMKSFASTLMKFYSISDTEVQVSIVQFASTAQVEAQMGTDAQGLYNAIAGMTQLGSGTNTVGGLTTANNQFTGQSTQAIIVVTDGQATEGGDPVAYANSLKKDNVVVFSVGVGDDVDVDELAGMASDPASSHLFTVKDFDSLEKSTESIAATSCMAAIGGCGANPV